MKQRWYDSDPTLSMAVSLLQNASAVHQEMTARYVFHQLEAENWLDSSEMTTVEGRLLFIFPRGSRNSFDKHCRKLLEVLKRLPDDIQQRMALQVINYIYILDAQLSEDTDPEKLGEASSIVLFGPEHQGK